MSETLKRSLSGLVYIALLISCLLLSKTAFSLLIFCFMMVATFEFSHIIKSNTWVCLALNFVVGILLLLSPYYLGSLVYLSIPFFIYLIYLLFKSNFFPLSSKPWKVVHLLGYALFPFIAIIFLRENAKSAGIVIAYFIIIWSNDSFAYICGRKFGKRKLFEKVSPKKTVEGFFGGLIFATLTSIICFEILKEQSILHWIINAFIISVFGTIGDLVESKYKRQAAIKDSGKIMPGHGGILDRLDSFIFIAPLLLLINQYF